MRQPLPRLVTTNKNINFYFSQDLYELQVTFVCCMEVLGTGLGSTAGPYGALSYGNSYDAWVDMVSGKIQERGSVCILPGWFRKSSFHG